MENILTFCAKFLIFLIVFVVVVYCDATYYMKKDHSLIKPYAGVSTSSKGSTNDHFIILFFASITRIINIRSKTDGGSIKSIHLYLNFVFFGFKIAVFFRFNL